jgi:hypothetical protein
MFSVQAPDVYDRSLHCCTWPRPVACRGENLRVAFDNPCITTAYIL